MPTSLFTAPTYDFKYEKAGRLLRIVLEGVWEVTTLARFAAEMDNIAESTAMIVPVDRRGRILIDLSNFPVQRAEIIEALAHLLPTLGQRAGKVAVVKSKSALQNRQSKRLLGGHGVQFVESLDAGLAWLGETGHLANA